MTEHLDDEQISASADRERAGVRHPTEIAQHLATCELCRARVRETLDVIDALRRYGHVRAPRPFAVPEATPVRLRPTIPAWASVASLAASLVLFLSVAGTARLEGAATSTAPAAAPAVSVASSGSSSASEGGRAAVQQPAAPTARPAPALAPAGPASAGNASAPRASAAPAVQQGSPAATAPAGAAAPFGAAAPPTPAATRAVEGTDGAAASSAKSGPAVPTAAASPPVPAVQTPIRNGEPASPNTSGRPAPLVVAAWQVLALAAGLVLLIFGVATLWLSSRGRATDRTATP